MLDAILIRWVETERGWGIRPDGCTIHANEEDYKNYVKEYNEDLPDEVPDIYSRPDGEIRKVVISKELNERLLSSDNGICLWENDFRDYKNNNQILFKD